MDKQAKDVLKEIILLYSKTSKPVTITTLKKKFKVKREQILIICDYLEENHKIKYQYYPDYNEKEYVLPVNEELHPAVYKFESFLSSLKSKVLDIIELSISFAALIVSIIALVK